MMLSKLDHTFYSGWTSLMAASQNGHLDIVKILIEQGAIINIKDRAG